MATPQITIRVDDARLAGWKACAEAHGYNLSEMIRRLMDEVTEGHLDPPPPPRTGRCRFGGPETCNQPHLSYPWAETCSSCGHRYR